MIQAIFTIATADFVRKRKALIQDVISILPTVSSATKRTAKDTSTERICSVILQLSIKVLLKLVEYVYDAWGNCTVTYDTNDIGARNPMRYRDYYWDKDLKMYYLTTRYYDPKTGRFINADTPDYLDPETLGGLNLYAYCHNNPVMNIDPRGNFAWLVIAAAVLLVACVVSLSSCSKEEEKEAEYHYASNDDSIKEGAINYNITPAKDNSEPQIRIFNSHLITDDNKKREILKYIINTDEGKAAGLSESDIEYYVKEWNSHNLVYTFFDFLDIFVDSEEINSYKYRTGHVDCNTDDSKSGIYKIIGGIAGWFW